jgi:hypothetical protein
MDTSHNKTNIQKPLQQAIIGFFILCALFAIIVYIVAPSIYAAQLKVSSTPTDRYPFLATLLLVAILAIISVGIIGVACRWRWLFWLLLLAFGFSILEIPVTVLLLMVGSSMLDSTPFWYTISRMAVSLLEVGLAVWMIQVYRHYGVWAMGKNNKQT